MPSSSKPASKPYVAATPRSVFGDVPSDYIEDPSRSVLDVDGYSDKRREIELALRDGKRVPALSHRFHWVRSKGSASRVPEFKSKGYRTVTREAFEGLGITFDPNTMDIAPDGTVQCGDLTLMVVDGQRAAAIQRQIYELDNAPTASMRNAEGRAAELGTSITLETSSADER